MAEFVANAIGLVIAPNCSRDTFGRVTITDALTDQAVTDGSTNFGSPKPLGGSHLEVSCIT